MNQKILISAACGIWLAGCVRPIRVVDRPFPVNVIRVGLAERQPEVKLSAKGGIVLEADQHRSATNRTLRFQARGKKILLDRQEFEALRVRAAAENEGVRWNGRRWRGWMELRPDPDGGMVVINALDIEDYVRGVLTKEVHPEWPMHALFAHAVLSRTLAAGRIGGRQAKGYDVTATVSDQVYGGMDSEHPRTDEAVQATRGEILVYKDKPARVMFHNSCGGRTENARYVWAGDFSAPYLRGVKCGFCKSADPWRNWRLNISAKELSQILGDGDVRDIQVKNRTASGRAQRVVIQGAKGTRTLTGHRLRMAVGPDRLRSTIFEIRRNGGDFLITGRGWGHGVGLCQWGARGMAIEGRRYDQILRHYFPGTRIARYER